MARVSSTISYGATMGAGMVMKSIDLCPISVVDCPTNCVAGLRRRSTVGGSSTGRDFGGRASWSRSGAFLWGPILKREPQAETTRRCVESAESVCPT